MITRTRLNVMLHAHCLSCYYVNINSAEREASHVLWAVSQLSQATYPAHLQWPLQHSKHCHWTVDFTFHITTALRLKCCQNFTTEQQTRWRTTPHTATPGRELTKGCHPPHHVGSRYVTQQVPDMNDVTNSVGMLTAQLKHRTQPEQTHSPLDKERKTEGKTWSTFLLMLHDRQKSPTLKIPILCLLLLVRRVALRWSWAPSTDWTIMTGKNWNTRGRNQSQSHVVYHKSHTTRTRIETGLPRLKTSD